MVPGPNVRSAIAKHGWDIAAAWVEVAHGNRRASDDLRSATDTFLAGTAGADPANEYIIKTTEAFARERGLSDDL